jgi:hypothetical protein
MQSFQFHTEDGPVSIAIRALVIAGWTGRDAAAVQHHIAELAALGVTPPAHVPLYYQAGCELLTHAPQISVLGPATSGEVEPMIVSDQDGTLWLGLASDHTDRALETVSVAKSKQICPKPLASVLWRLEDVFGHLDKLQLRSEILEAGAGDFVIYQSGTLASIRPLQELMSGLPGGALAPSTALFCGTVPAIGGIRPADRFRMSLQDPVRNQTIAFDYAISALQIVE